MQCSGKDDDAWRPCIYLLGELLTGPPNSGNVLRAEDQKVGQHPGLLVEVQPQKHVVAAHDRINALNCAVETAIIQGRQVTLERIQEGAVPVGTGSAGEAHGRKNEATIQKDCAGK